MLFNTPLVSFVTAIALASGITASVLQVRDPPICPPGTVTEGCCISASSIDELKTEPYYPQIEDYLGNSTDLVGVNCASNPEFTGTCPLVTCCSTYQILNVTCDNVTSILADCV